ARPPGQGDGVGMSAMASRTRSNNGPGNTAAARAALDVMLTDAAVSRSAAGRFLDPVSTAKFAGALARRPLTIARRAEQLGAEIARVAGGSSEIAPTNGDRRFADRAWSESW